MRLIDADALLESLMESREALHEIYERLPGFQEKVNCFSQIATIKEAILRVKAAPTIEAEPVRHGKWIEDRTDIVCPVCNTAFSDEIAYMKRAIDPEYPKRCPECGAKMDGGGENA